VIFNMELTGEDEDEVYEELMMCLEGMRDAGRKFEHDVMEVVTPNTSLINARHHLEQALAFLLDAS
jgi:hypothetical protein